MLGIVVITLWAVLWCLPLFYVLDRLGVLRIPPEMEVGGMDAVKHNEASYPWVSWQEDFARSSSYSSPSPPAADDSGVVGHRWTKPPTFGIGAKPYHDLTRIINPARNLAMKTLC